MEKITPGTPDLTQENVEKIAALFPNAVTEATDADGNLVRAIDFDALRENLTCAPVVEGTRERYQFTWPGKRESKLEARRPTRKVMRPQPEKSKDWDTTQNLYIEGDNLEALKIMRETYAGKVKLIYIDPPYNTGHDFVYDDDFSQTREEYEAQSGDFDETGGRLVANLESNGRFHSDWCSMMYPRLLLARDLLAADGAICISIDDGEVRNAKNICDEIFGQFCFVAQLVWKSRQNKDNRTVNGISSDHEYILVYSKSTGGRVFRGSERDESSYRNPDNDPKGPWASANMVGLATASARPNLHYDLVNPATGINYGCPEKGWRYDRAGMARLINEGLILWPDNPEGRPRRKKYLSELSGDLPGYPSIVCDDIYTRNGSIEIRDLLEAPVFDFPKPSELIRSLIEQTTASGDLVLDFFSGSASTAHAVFSQNVRDGGTRRFILVQLPERCEGNEAAKAGYKTICEIGEERIRRAGAKIADEVDKANEQLELGADPKPLPDLGFRVLAVGDSVIKDEYAEPGQYEQASLDLFANNAVEGATDLDLLFQVLPAFRIPYSASIAERTLGGKRVLDVNEGQLIACFDTGVGVEAIEAIAKERPLYAVFRDACFAGDSDVANLEELFKTFSPDTIRKVI